MGDAHIRAVVHALQSTEVNPDILDCVTPIATHNLAPNQNVPQEHGSRRGLIRSLPSYPLDLLPAEVHAWSEFADGILSNPDVDWLSSLGAIRQADNKIYQLHLARQANVAFPKTLVARTVADVHEFLGDTAVLKPLGSGVLDDGSGNGSPRVFYSTIVNVADLADDELARAPVLAQEPIMADRHLRIVTLNEQIWCASLSAHGVAFDWRESPSNTQLAWEPFKPPDHVIEEAVRLTALAGIGFSSQDWLEAEERYWFLDLNPVGKWLFLPKGIAEQVTTAIAAWLCSKA